MATKSELLLYTMRIYWRSIFVVAYPLSLLPVILIDDEKAKRCLYVVMLMGGYWVTEALPIPVTAFIPLVLFPLLGIMGADETIQCYQREPIMMFIGSMIIAIAVEHCDLHKRLALAIILLVGCSPRNLSFGLMAVSMFVSMWISNIAAISMMCPIIEAILKELEAQGISNVHKNIQNGREQLLPTTTTVCYYLGTAYAVSLGGIGSLTGSGVNLTFKGIYESRFPNSSEIYFTTWMLFNVPIMLITTFLVWVWMQFLFMGLFRKNNDISRQLKLVTQNEGAVSAIVHQKVKDMGPITFHQGSVACLFFLSILLWIFRKPASMTGWAELVSDQLVLDSTAALLVVLLLFILPAKLTIIDIFNKSKRPESSSSSLLTWKIVRQKLPWGLIFLLGGGFALSVGSQRSGMSKMIADHLDGLLQLSKFSVLLICCSFASFMTEFTCSIATANIILPILADMTTMAGWNPIYLMLPAAVCCSHAFCLPVGSPANALVTASSNTPTKTMVKAGIGTSIIALAVLLSAFPYLGDLTFDIKTHPDM